jgi:hypothetical protein
MNTNDGAVRGLSFIINDLKRLSQRTGIGDISPALMELAARSERQAWEVLELLDGSLKQDEIQINMNKSQATLVIEAVALRMEMRQDAQVDWHLNQVVKQIQEYGHAKWNMGKNLLDLIRYPIKKVTVSYYETNPKQKP